MSHDGGVSTTTTVVPARMKRPILLVLDGAQLTKGSLATLAEAFRGLPFVTEDLLLKERVVVENRVEPGKRSSLRSPLVTPPRNIRLYAEDLKRGLILSDVPLKDEIAALLSLRDPQMKWDNIIVPQSEEGLQPPSDELRPGGSDRAVGTSMGSHPDLTLAPRIESSAPAGFRVGKLYQGSTPARSIADCWSSQSPKEEVASNDNLHNSSYIMVDSKSYQPASYATQEKRVPAAKREKHKTKGPAHWS